MGDVATAQLGLVKDRLKHQREANGRAEEQVEGMPPTDLVQENNALVAQVAQLQQRNQAIERLLEANQRAAETAGEPANSNQDLDAAKQEIVELQGPQEANQDAGDAGSPAGNQLKVAMQQIANLEAELLQMKEQNAKLRDEINQAAGDPSTVTQPPSSWPSGQVLTVTALWALSLLFAYRRTLLRLCGLSEYFA